MHYQALQSIQNLPDFALYFVGALFLFFVFISIYVRVTPYKEIELIRNGNVAAAISLTGSAIGFCLGLGSVISHSAHIIDVFIWGGIALTVQILTYFIVAKLTKDLHSKIPEGSVAHGLFLGGMSISVGILMAACMTY